MGLLALLAAQWRVSATNTLGEQEGNMGNKEPRSTEMDQYMRDINKFPILSREEEASLTHKYAQTKSKTARDAIINANLRFVVKTAHEYRGYGFPLLDLVQEGNVGLVRALDKFQPSRELKFISYGVWWVRAYIQKYVINNWSLVKVGTTSDQKKLFYNLKRVQAKLWGPDYSHAKVAELLKVDESVVIEMDTRLRHKDTSLDIPLSEDTDGPTFTDTVVDSNDTPLEAAYKKQFKEGLDAMIAKAMRSLSRKESKVITKRFLEEDGQTLHAIGEDMRLSRERIRQIETQAISKMRKQLQNVAA